MSAEPRFPFITQQPRDDGCGVVVLQMLTGRPYNELASLIGFGPGEVHYSTWKELTGALAALGWSFGEPREVASWAEVSGIAVVHVEPDHFILYDAENGDFYDPAQVSGPEKRTALVPRSYLSVRPPT